MTAPVPCRRCGEELCSPVRFCPFCAAPQAAVAQAVPASLAVPGQSAPSSDGNQAGAGSPSADLPRSRPFAPRPPEPQRRPEPVAPGARQPVVPMTSARPAASPATATRATPRPASRTRRRNPNRAAATRKLAAAAFVLFCAVVLWRQLLAVPHATLTVHLSRPADGSVLVDGISSGAPDAPIVLAPGRHTVGLDAPGFDTMRRSVRVADGAAETLTLSPVPRPARLVLDTEPSGAAITLDGRAVGRTPLQRSLPPGRHAIEAVLADHLPETREIALAPGASPHLSIALRPVPLRTLRLEAPAGRWSEPAILPPGSRFTLLFQAAVRVRIGGRVLLLQPGRPVALGDADAGGLGFTAAGAGPVPVELLVVPPGDGNPD